MERWDTDCIGMMGPGYLRIDEDGGETAFGCVTTGFRCEVGKASIWVRFSGSDDMEGVSGDGDAELEEDGSLTSEIRFDDGDESSFCAKPW